MGIQDILLQRATQQPEQQQQAAIEPVPNLPPAPTTPVGTSGMTPAKPEVVDKQIKAALELLSQDERPTVPVRTYTDPEKAWHDILLPLGQRRLTQKAVGFTPDDHSAIYFKQGSDDYNDMYKLASKIIHENVHAKAAEGDRDEVPAYQAELAWIDKHPVNFPVEYRKAIAEYIAALQKAKAQKK